MKGFFTILLIFLMTFSTVSIFSLEVNAQGTPEQLTTNLYKDRQPSWSLDGTKIFYSAFSDSWHRHIWVMNSDGSGKSQLTSGDVVDEQPACSPDQSKIVFTRWGFRGDYSDIMMMDADGSNIQRLTFGGVSGKPEGTYNGVEWSQDGTKLIFMYIEGTTGTPWEVRNFWICTMNPDGTGLTVLGRGIWPKFVLGDTKILFNTELPEFKIAIMNADGTDIQILTSGPADHSPDMATFSHRIIFTRALAHGELGDLYTMDADGSNQIPILTDGQNVEAYWSPDEKYIVYVSGKSGNWDIWKMEAPPVEVSINIDPNTLNLKSKGKWITDYIEFPEGYDVNDVDVSTIMLNDSIPAEMHHVGIEDEDDDGIPDLMVKFDRAEVTSYIIANVNMTKLIEEKFMTITLTITGKLYDETQFQGSDTIRIIMHMPRGLAKLLSHPIPF